LHLPHGVPGQHQQGRGAQPCTAGCTAGDVDAAVQCAVPDQPGVCGAEAGVPVHQRESAGWGGGREGWRGANQEVRPGGGGSGPPNRFRGVELEGKGWGPVGRACDHAFDCDQTCCACDCACFFCAPLTAHVTAHVCLPLQTWPDMPCVFFLPKTPDTTITEIEIKNTVSGWFRADLKGFGRARRDHFVEVNHGSQKLRVACFSLVTGCPPPTCSTQLSPPLPPPPSASIPLPSNHRFAPQCRPPWWCPLTTSASMAARGEVRDNT
jgi:hypothetical protein